MPHLLWQSGSLEHLTLGVCIIQLVKDWDRRYQCLERLQNTTACHEIIAKQNGTLIINGYLKISLKKNQAYTCTNKSDCSVDMHTHSKCVSIQTALQNNIKTVNIILLETINNINITQISTITTKLIIFQAHQKKAPNNIIISSLSH